ncbi:MAG: hypothetical protein J0M04_23955 [Verrucomicrobia bacterium]|nr:hypothetical protein [Verrucomicrobiota bacterium]
MKAQDSLERELENRLRVILGAVPGLGTGVKVWRNPAASDRSFDIMGELELPRSNDRVELWVECRDLPRPSQFPFVNLSNRILQHGSRGTVVPVLAAPHISPRMAELCEGHGWSWFDLAGNCRLVVPGALYIERTGLAAVHERQRPKANLSSAASARVLRALLAPRNAAVNWSQTALRMHCEPGVSIGLVNKVVSHLRDEAWLEQRDDGKFRVKDAIGLLDVWRKSYRFERHRRIGYFTLLKPQELRNRLQTMNPSAGEIVYAAFSAADFQAPCVRQNKTWLYVSDAALDEFVRVADAKRVDTGENLVVLVPEDDGVFYLRDAGNGEMPARTNPVQTWLDLRHVGGRGEEAAEAVLNQCLKPVWEGAVRHV